MATPLHPSSAPNHVSLSDHDKQQLVDFVARYCSNASELTHLQVLSLVQRHPVAVALPSIQASLEALVRNEFSYLCISNLPEDAALPAPPSNGLRPAGKGWLSEVVILSLLQASGLSVFSYDERCGSPLIQEVAPAALRAGELSSLGSAELGMHTDKGFLPSPFFRPEFLCLHGLVNEAGIPTLIADLDQALALLKRRNPTFERVLWEPRFRLAKPACLRSDSSKSLYSDARCLISECHGVASLAGNMSTLLVTDELASRAVEAFKLCIAKVAHPMVLVAGVACVFSNSRLLHGRAGIGPSSRRWLQRSYGRGSLEHLRLACARPGGSSFPLSTLIL
jgi:hypothetical protein